VKKEMVTVTRSANILIVDDENIVRKSLRRRLSKEGYHCEEADGAEQALKRLDDNKIDLIILDIRMPGKSGLELLPEIKDRYPDIAVIMITAVMETEVAVDCMKQGATDYVTKPFNLDKVLLVVDQALQKRNLERKNREHFQSLEQRLQAENEQRTGFLQSVAHEIKTPLTAIIASSELLDEEISLTNPDQKLRIVSNIARSAKSIDDRLSRLINYNRMQTGKLELQKQPTEIAILIKDTASRLLPFLARRDQSLYLDIKDALPQMELDKGKLEEILSNLLSNAINFSHQGGRITVHAEAVDNKVFIKVEDSAPIINDDEKDRLFEPYYRGEDSEQIDRIPGLGLGLTVAKKLVELHGGEMWIDTNLGKGNIFAFSLPINGE
jgi:signal transduction histidine kinase